MRLNETAEKLFENFGLVTQRLPEIQSEDKSVGDGNNCLNFTKPKKDSPVHL